MIRHVVARQQGVHVEISFNSIKVDELCKGTKKVAQRVYDLIKYIDVNIELKVNDEDGGGNSRKKNSKADSLVGSTFFLLILFIK